MSVANGRTLGELRAEYNALLESWDYAFAMGHGCSNDGGHPRFVATRQRATDLRALIAEHTA